jgi:hypothetical protein
VFASKHYRDQTLPSGFQTATAAALLGYEEAASNFERHDQVFRFPQVAIALSWGRESAGYPEESEGVRS